MDKISELLYALNSCKNFSQRTLADTTGFSLGLINALLREMKENDYITFEKIHGKKNIKYKITEKGEKLIESTLLENQEKKLLLADKKSYVKLTTAVILATDKNPEFTLPTGLLRIDNTTITDRIISKLDAYGFDKIYIVTGFKTALYKEHFKNRNVKIIENTRFRWTGTMYSLSLCASYIDDDFLLIKGDNVFEERMISDILDFPENSAVAVTSVSGSGNETFAELNDDLSIFKISKDIHQLNSIDYEMTGVSKISKLLFEKMLENYKTNKNPYINYEYVIENIARVFKVAALKLENISWAEIDTKKHFDFICENVIFSIKRKEHKIQKNKAEQILKTILKLNDKDIKKLNIVGGMTNNNYRIKTISDEYILRMPGEGTDVFVSRSSEKNNSELVTSLGICPKDVYFDASSGIKVSEFIKNSEVLNPATASLEKNIRLISELLLSLHSSKIKFNNCFNVFDEYRRYREQSKGMSLKFYDDFLQMENKFFSLEKRLKKIGVVLSPCHNDTVAENFIKSMDGRIYLIDWEYSGMNDPMWDIAEHFLECSFSEDEENMFLSCYFKDKINSDKREKILIYKICQDMLWSFWALIKEAKGEDLKLYGQKRFSRCCNLMKEYTEK